AAASHSLSIFTAPGCSLTIIGRRDRAGVLGSRNHDDFRFLPLLALADLPTAAPAGPHPRSRDREPTRPRFGDRCRRGARSAHLAVLAALRAVSERWDSRWRTVLLPCGNSVAR